MEKINFKTLDNALNEALKLCAETEAERLHRSVKVSNIKHAYSINGIFWPALDAKQRVVFDECTEMAKQIGIER